MPFVVGLTGGIGSGKSTVAKLFASLGASIINADQLAREVVKPGSPALAEIAQHFGEDAITTNGTLDRSILRKKIFQNDSDRFWLESLLHPLIAEERLKQIDSATTPYVIVEIPLLFEKQLADEVDRVLVVDTTEALQKSRVAKRDQINTESVEAVMNTQVDRENRLSGADDIIDNSGDIEDLNSQVQALNEKYLRLAAQSG